MIRHIPNLLTLCNLVCGCLGIVYAFNGELEWSGFMIGIAAVFDFLDGFAARLLNAKSPIGGQLDSLADMVTFGALPGIILFQLISISYGEYFTTFGERELTHRLVPCLAFLIPAFSALRLAKFNIDETQSDSFLGMPTPSIAILIGSLPIMLWSLDFNFYNVLNEEMLIATKKVKYWGNLNVLIVSILQNPSFLSAFAVVCSAMLVVPIRMIALKFKGFSWSNNKTIYWFLIIVSGVVFLAVLPYIFYFDGLPVINFLAIPIIMLLYPAYSIVNNLVNRD